MFGYVLLLVVAGLRWNSVEGWTPPPAAPNRRGFLQTATAGAVVVASGAAVTSRQQQQQEQRTYQPTPGSLTGQTHVITGGTTGLGLESAKRLAAAGATVVLTARSETKGERAKLQVLEYLQQQRTTVQGVDESNTNINNNVHYLTLDLEHFHSIRSFPQRFQALMSGTSNKPKIHVLMNNAGLVTEKRALTEDGFERTFQTNHLGPFLLTSLLFPYLDRNKGARIINVSSVAHTFATLHGTTERGLDLENFNGDLHPDWGGGWPAYGQSKLENILFTQELQRRADAAGLEWCTAVSLHPGVVGTDIWREQLVGKNRDGSLLSTALSSLFYKSVVTTERGANTQVMLAASQNDRDICKGQYYNEDGHAVRLDAFARDDTKAKALWEMSETLAGGPFRVA